MEICPAYFINRCWIVDYDEIPLLTQIVTVADAFDAMTSRRSYREAMPRDKAISILNECSGTQFNPFLVGVFTEIETDRLRRHGKAALPGSEKS